MALLPCLYHKHPLTSMIIRDELLNEHSKEQAAKIAGYACAGKRNFQELINCFLDKDWRIAQRAAWSVSMAAEKNPSLMQPHIKTLVAQLDRTDVHAAVIRNSVRILQQIEIPEAYHGDVMNACFKFIETPSTPAAIKAFSLTVLHRLSAIYPDIKAELKLIIEESYEQETAAFKSRANHLLKNL